MRLEVIGVRCRAADGVDTEGADTVRVCDGFREVFDGCIRGSRDGDTVGFGSSGALRGRGMMDGTGCRACGEL